MPSTQQPTISVFQRTLDNLPDGVLLISSRREVLYANKSFFALWNVPEAIVANTDRNLLFAHVSGQTADPIAFRDEVLRLYDTEESSQDEILCKDGRLFSRRSVPFRQDCEGLGRIWIFTDVTEAWNAQRDTLTGLPNRRAYSRSFSKIAGMDDGLVTGVAIMDIDNFKGYNDLYGHAAGDVVLQQMGRLLASRIGGDDNAFRIGGEEFLISCRGRTPSKVIEFFEALRKSVEDEAILHKINAPAKVVTASFGLALFKGPREVGELFDAADKALYVSKADGRNRITVTDLTQLRHGRRKGDRAPAPRISVAS